jgi:cytochrome c oxidase assembly protein subunit 15
MSVNFFRQKPNPCFYLTFFCAALTFLVVLLGAYTRLTDAGLGCPDWPGCYGDWIVNQPLSAINTAKAWTEMIHRYLAGCLMLSIATLFLSSIYYRRKRYQPLSLPILILLLVLFQAVLGMWTVTLKLSPIIVIAHLFGGFLTLALLGCLAIRLKPPASSPLSKKTYTHLKFWGSIALLWLLLQIFLGGATSANYAALVCLDFPFCNAHQSIAYQWPTTPLNFSSLATIHMLHRFGALISVILLTILALKAFLQKQNIFIRRMGFLIFGFSILQTALGITNVLAILPLRIAVAHNGAAALLLMLLVVLNDYLYHLPKFKRYGA